MVAKTLSLVYGNTDIPGSKPTLWQSEHWHEEVRELSKEEGKTVRRHRAEVKSELWKETGKNEEWGPVKRLGSGPLP